MSEKRTYEEILKCLPDVDIFVIEAKVTGLNNKIDTLEKSFAKLTAVVLEYYDNIKVLNANSERILMTLNPTRTPKKT